MEKWAVLDCPPLQKLRTNGLLQAKKFALDPGGTKRHEAFSGPLWSKDLVNLFLELIKDLFGTMVDVPFMSYLCPFKDP